MASNIRKRLSSPNKIEALYYNKPDEKILINKSIVEETFCFFTFYMIIVVIGSLTLMITENCNLSDGFFEFVSVMGTVGLSSGITGPNSNSATLIVEMIGMVLGRLEIFIVITGLNVGIRMAGKSACRLINKKSII